LKRGIAANFSMSQDNNLRGIFKKYAYKCFLLGIIVIYLRGLFCSLFSNIFSSR
jgi:hypothetical protein